MKQFKLLACAVFIFSISSIAFASDWPPPINYTVKFTVNNQSSDTFAWQSRIIPLDGQNPISANSQVQLQGNTNEYYPLGTITLSNKTNSAENCIIQDGIIISSYKVLQNASSGSGFTCAVSNNIVFIEPSSTHN